MAFLFSHQGVEAKLVFDKVGRKFPQMKTVYADSIYVCNGFVVVLPLAAVLGDRQASGGFQGFVLVAKRWIVERTFAWISRPR